MRANTIKVSGGSDYAKVSERTKLFWEENPKGSIISTYDDKSLNDGMIIFSTTIIRNAEKLDEGKTNGHAMGKLEKDKDFEKYETISLGRALAKAGYLASGEIASFEEMEDFIVNKAVKLKEYIEEQTKLFKEATNLDELKTLWLTTNKTIPEIIKAKENRKFELTTGVKNENN